jgi:hypothetical protein
VPREITAIISREYVFQLKLNEYNLKKCWENYTVYKIFEAQVAEEANNQKVAMLYMLNHSNLHNIWLHNYMQLLMKLDLLL